MDNLWLWLFGLVALISLAVFMFPMFPLFRKPALAPKKLELPRKPRKQPAEEMAEEITLATPLSKREPDEIFLPHHYGVSRLVVAVKDPHWLYAYWEVSIEKQKEFIKRYGQEAWDNSRQVLRVYDITGFDGRTHQSSHSYQEICLEPFADNWFIQVGQPERSFFLELGRLLSDGTYVKLLTSNKITTPRTSVSPRIDEQWMWIEGIYQNLGDMRYGTSSQMLAGKEGGYKQ